MCFKMIKTQHCKMKKVKKKMKLVTTMKCSAVLRFAYRIFIEVVAKNVRFVNFGSAKNGE